MHRIFIKCLNVYIQISEEGNFELPPREYNPTLLRKVAREISRAMRENQLMEYTYGEDD